jgi:hypothetical protein
MAVARAEMNNVSLTFPNRVPLRRSPVERSLVVVEDGDGSEKRARTMPTQWNSRETAQTAPLLNIAEEVLVLIVNFVLVGNGLRLSLAEFYKENLALCQICKSFSCLVKKCDALGVNCSMERSFSIPNDMANDILKQRELFEWPKNKCVTIPLQDLDSKPTNYNILIFNDVRRRSGFHVVLVHMLPDCVSSVTDKGVGIELPLRQLVAIQSGHDRRWSRDLKMKRTTLNLNINDDASGARAVRTRIIIHHFRLGRILLEVCKSSSKYFPEATLEFDPVYSDVFNTFLGRYDDVESVATLGFIDKENLVGNIRFEPVHEATRSEIDLSNVLETGRRRGAATTSDRLTNSIVHIENMTTRSGALRRAGDAGITAFDENGQRDAQVALSEDEEGSNSESDESDDDSEFESTDDDGNSNDPESEDSEGSASASDEDYDDDDGADQSGNQRGGGVNKCVNGDCYTLCVVDD